jgi:hypothetical protein
MKAVGQKLSHANMVLSWCLIPILHSSRNIIRYVQVPTHLSLGKKKNIVKSGIEWV